MKTIITLTLLGISLCSFGQSAELMARADKIYSVRIQTEVAAALPANQPLTSAETATLLKDVDGKFREYLGTKVTEEEGTILGLSSFNDQTSMWKAYAKRVHVNHLNDREIVPFAVKRMVAGGILQRNDAAPGDLIDQVIAYLEANHESTVPQAYLDFLSNR